MQMKTVILVFISVVAVVGLPQAAVARRQAMVSPVDTHVILFIVDSVSAELVYDLIDSGELPNLATALRQTGVRVDEAIAPFPTISFYAHTCILTGDWADRHGVPAIRWFDRHTQNSRSYAGVGAMLIDRDINPDVKTIFERLSDLNTVSIGSVVHRGVDEYIPPLLPPDGLRVKSLMRRFQRPNPPNLSVVVLTGIDWPAHRYGPKSAWVRIDLRKLDRELGQLFSLLKKRGLDKNTYVVLTADHGHAPASGRVDLYSHLTHLGFDILDKFLYTARTEFFTSYDAVLWMAGVGYAFLYLPHRTDTEMSWESRPDEQMLRHYPVGGKQIDVIRSISELPQIAFTVIRDPATGNISAFGSGGPLDIHTDLAPYPDAEAQLPHLMAAPRAPDILVVAKDGYETAWSWHHGRHGGYSRLEMIVPLIMIGPGIRPHTVPRAKTIDITPTILTWFGRPVAAGELDGVSIDLEK